MHQANLLTWVFDRMNLDYQPVQGSTLGCDFSGTVEALGPSLTKSLDVGDRVLGWALGNNIVRKDEGGFAEYCVANADLLIKIPEGMSDEDAASPPAGIATAGMGLFQKHGMVMPGESKGGKGEQVLVYGGSTATATLAIQFGML